MPEPLGTETAVLAEPELYVMPASYAQQRIWFLEQWHPGGATFHIPAFFALHGTLDAPALRQSMGLLVARHEALRTTFVVEDGRLLQQVSEAQPDPSQLLPVFDLQQVNETARETAVAQHQSDMALTPFDLTTGPLWRARLLQLTPDHHLFLLTLHHIIADGWSMDILCRELSQAYQALAAGQQPSLPALPLQYADYAIWQQEQLASPAFAAQLAYWRQQLGGTLPALDLPLDFARPTMPASASQRETVTLPPTLTARLQQLGQQKQVSLFMLLLAGFKLWLHRQTSQDDLIVGVPIAGRTQQEIEHTLGCFLNTLALRTQLLAATQQFDDLLAQVRQTTLDAYDNQDVPFELLLAELQPERDTSRTPVFQVMMNMLTEGELALSLTGIRATLLPLPEIGSKFDITLYVETVGDSLRLTAVYNKSLFTAVRIQNMLAQYHHLLAQIVANPSRPLWDYSLVTPENAAVLPNPQEALSTEWHGSVVTQFARQASQLPEKDAVIDGYGRVTYRQLLSRVNQLAHQLAADGVQAEEVVAIYGHRSASLLWAMLGVLRAGAAFVILDPTYPPERLRRYLEVAQIKGWIQLEAAGELPAPLQRYLAGLSLRSQLILPTALSGEASPVAHQPITEPQIPFAPDALAYLAFTSGTTGQPKAIMGTKRPLSHFIAWYQKRFDLRAEDHFSMLSGLAHDPLLRDIFAPLVLGATLHIPDLAQMAPGELAHWLGEAGITVAHLTPAMSQLLTTGVAATSQLPALRYAVFGGEPLTPRHVARLQELAPHVVCVNFYGATETPQAMGYHVIKPSDVQSEAGSSVIPVGQGIDDVQLLLLNRNGRLAGVGELAEIYVRTPYLSRGYLTVGENGRFLPNPFGQTEDDRVYRTGDQARYLPDGTVTFAGRQDRQVKIRGFRIELAEIEQTLLHHPDCQDVYVHLHSRHDTQDDQLVAYIIPAHGSALDLADLRTFLQMQLPQYMVPAIIMPVPAFPLTANGKLNTAALPQPDETLRQSNPTARPQTPLEKQMVEIWQKVLGLPAIGIHDNFFALGGHSLLAVKLFTQIEKRFKTKLPIGTIFQMPTVALLTQAINKQEVSEKWQTLVPMQPKGAGQPLFFVHGGAGHVFLFDKLAAQFRSSRPFYAFQPNDWENRHKNPPDITQMAAQYVAEMRLVQSSGPYVVGGFCFGGTIAMEMARQLEVMGETVHEVLLVEPGPPALHRKTAVRSPIAQTPAANRHKGEPKTLRFRLGRLKWALKQPIIKLRNDAKGWRRSWQATVVKLLLWLNRPIPPSLRDTYFLHFVSRKSWDNYESVEINGRIRLFLHHNRTPEDPRWHWLQLADKNSEFHILPTDHFGILQSPHVEAVFKIIHEETFK